MVWIVDGYTTLDNYPYAQRSRYWSAITGCVSTPPAARQDSYIRNSVKATVDAYDGTVTLYESTTRPGAAGVDEGVPRHRQARE